MLYNTDRYGCQLNFRPDRDAQAFTDAKETGSSRFLLRSDWPMYFARMPRRLRRLRFISLKIHPLIRPLLLQVNVLEWVLEGIKAWTPEILLRDVARHGWRAQAYREVSTAVPKKFFRRPRRRRERPIVTRSPPSGTHRA
jgi:hypothetical protein